MKKRFNLNNIKSILFSVFIGILVIFAYGDFQKKLNSMYTFVSSVFLGTDTASTLPRLRSWQEAIELYSNHPLNGVGIGAYGYAFVDIYGSDQNPSKIKTTNMFLEILAEGGWLGLLVFVIWLLIPFSLIFLRNNLKANVLFLSWISTVCILIFMQTWLRPYFWFTWLLCVSFYIKHAYHKNKI